MTYEKLLSIIEKYNLSIRRIPLTVTLRWLLSRVPKPNEKVVLVNDRHFIKEVKIPINPGCYMVQSVNNTLSQVHWQWNSTSDTFGKGATLEEAIENFLSKQEKEST